MIRELNSLLKLAEKDIEVSQMILQSSNDELLQNIAAYHSQQSVEKLLKYLIVENGGNAGIGHDIKMLSIEVNELGGSVPEWVIDGSYDLSSWATTIRYNSNFKTNRDLIESFNEKIIEWLGKLKEQ
ncbi:MAG TPA: HEPN domain-containing protein [Anaerovoracaceae bacterium]|nr:HEPN domain-containing protein [Anaerovoracaceae bacterium]